MTDLEEIAVLQNAYYKYEYSDSALDWALRGLFTGVAMVTGLACSNGLLCF